MLTPGAVLGGRYRLDERIAGGGMGDVWRGSDEVLGRTVAVKVLLPSLMDETGFSERFRAEARTMATINHPGVVDVYDYGNENGTAFLVMEYVEGDALSRTLSRVGRLTPARTMALVAQASEALHAAHAKGIVHRDVKPGNLLVRPNGTLVLTDFGISRAAGAAQLTAVGSVLGTAAYLSPEQASGQQATALSDIYALGIVAYQCLSGRRPFEGDNPLEIAMRHVRDIPPPLPDDIPRPVRHIVERAIAKDPSTRWQSAAELAAVTRDAASQLSTGAFRIVGASPQATSLIAPSSGPPGAPSSGPPAPSSAETTPLSPAAQSVPAGTKVFAAPGDFSPRQPSPGDPHTSPMVNQQNPGGFIRGTAGVPPPPTAEGAPYTNVGFSPPPPTRNNRRGSRRNMIFAVGILSALISLTVATAGIIILSNHDKDSQNGGTSTTPTNNPTTTHSRQNDRSRSSPSSVLISVGCERLKGKQRLVVEKALKDQGFTVDVVMVSGDHFSQVVDITPCQARPGDTITIKVSTGQIGNLSIKPTISPHASSYPIASAPVHPLGSRN